MTLNNYIHGLMEYANNNPDKLGLEVVTSSNHDNFSEFDTIEDAPDHNVYEMKCGDTIEAVCVN